jgi:serine/threonine protein kinase
MPDDDQTQLPGESPRGSLLTVGQSFGQYKVIRLLGRGGMGEVYEVEHLTLGMRHAIKLIKPEIAQRPDAKERFKREARVMAQLRHPNIVHVDDFGELDDATWLRMELVGGQAAERAEGADLKPERGCNLGDLLTGEPLPEEFVVDLLTQILEGLSYAHERGVVHRDIKPANILLQPNPLNPNNLTPKITDFGLVSMAGADWLQSQVQLTVARSMADPDATRLEGASNSTRSAGSGQVGTSTQALLGTYAYMSPEQKKGTDVDARSDLYAVGLIAFQMLTGEETPGLEMPSDIVDGIDPSWDAWVRQSLASRPERRFSDAKSMTEALPSDNSSTTEAVSVPVERKQEPPKEEKEPPNISESGDEVDCGEDLKQQHENNSNAKSGSNWIGIFILSVYCFIAILFSISLFADHSDSDYSRGDGIVGLIGLTVTFGILYLVWWFQKRN